MDHETKIGFLVIVAQCGTAIRDSRLNLARIILSQNKQKWGNIRVTILLFRYNFIIVYTVMKM